MNVELVNLRGAAREKWAAEMNSGRVRLNVTLDTSSIARGAEDTLAALRNGVAANKLAADVNITGSWGFCWMEPCVAVRSSAGTKTVLYANVTADRVEEFLDRVVVQGQDMPELALGIVEGNATAEIPLLADHPFMKGQVRRLMANLGFTDPENIDHYMANGGYEGFGKALEMDAEAIIKEMLDSGLGGRGGGGFPAGRKWDFLRSANADPRYLICNADEGDPGAWVNRVLMEGDPHLIVEGMLIAALGAKARAGYIYIRYEYPLAIDRMRKAIADAYAKGLLGENILGTGLDFDLYVFKGAGAYVCGEETGLINSIDSYRGMPRIKPPFPAQAGLWNKPTNVNNVESYANAPLIMRNGAAWWSGVSDEKEKGTKMFTFSGSVNWQGCIEIPFGPTVRTALDQYAGGMKGGKACKGFQPGGPLSGMLNGRELDLTLTLDPYRGKGMFLGSGGIVFFDDSACVIDMCKFFVAFCEDESCGRCTTCHGGSQRAVEVMRRIQAGGGREADIDNLEKLIQTLVWSNCLHGQFTMTTVKTSLKEFRDEWVEHIVDKRCRAGVCEGLIQYRVRSQTASGLEEAAAICPTGAVQQERGQWFIDDGLCIRCGACKEQSPDGLEVVPRLAATPTLAAATAAGG
ncbi:MAG: NADH-quinone oxidoreductase subunit F [Dehalococcoidia bacterium]|nr:NADH-quinone oxidoreductase subunit F [Dehalococcoidia bacterium]